MQRSVAAAHRETGFDICGSTQLLWGGGGRGVERRDSSELWGEGCDHSVMEYYCHNANTHTHTEEVHTTANVYKHICVEMLMYDIQWQPSHTPPHAPVHR